MVDIDLVKLFMWLVIYFSSSHNYFETLLFLSCIHSDIFMFHITTSVDFQQYFSYDFCGYSRLNILSEFITTQSITLLHEPKRIIQ